MRGWTSEVIPSDMDSGEEFSADVTQTQHNVKFTIDDILQTKSPATKLKENEDKIEVSKPDSWYQSQVFIV